VARTGGVIGRAGVATFAKQGSNLPTSSRLRTGTPRSLFNIARGIELITSSLPQLSFPESFSGDAFHCFV
jgi:hypothetical protein